MERVGRLRVSARSKSRTLARARETAALSQVTLRDCGRGRE